MTGRRSSAASPSAQIGALLLTTGQSPRTCDLTLTFTVNTQDAPPRATDVMRPGFVRLSPEVAIMEFGRRMLMVGAFRSIRESTAKKPGGGSCEVVDSESGSASTGGQRAASGWGGPRIGEVA